VDKPIKSNWSESYQTRHMRQRFMYVSMYMFQQDDEEVLSCDQ
jgi:hypothetical protein